jgi:phosphoglycolate phosphatase
MIKLALFDFDDTLCMTEEACFHLENEAAATLGFGPMTRELHQSNWGHPLSDAVHIRFPGIDAEAFFMAVKSLAPKYLADGKLDVISHENIQAIHDLKSAGMKVGILTSRTLVEAEHLLADGHFLNELLDAFYHRDNTDFTKPDPRVFAKPLMDFGVQPHEAIYVGDSVGDAHAAKNAGMPFIALLQSGIRTEEDFKDIAVDYFAYSFPDIVPHILNHA